MFAIICPRCQATISVRDTDAGKKLSCPCGQRLLVPQPPPGKTVLAPLAPSLPTQQIPTTLHQPPVAQSVVPVALALAPNAPSRRTPFTRRVGILCGFAIAALFAAIIAIAKFGKSGQTDQKDDVSKKAEDPKEKNGGKDKIVPEDGFPQREPDFNNTDVLLKWLGRISEPVWKAADNEVAQERAIKVQDAELDRLKGKTVTWRLRVIRVVRTGVIVEPLGCPNGLDKASGYTEVDIADEGSESNPNNHLTVKNQDLLASLKAGDSVLVTGKVRSIRDLNRGVAIPEFRFTIRIAVVAVAKAKE